MNDSPMLLPVLSALTLFFILLGWLVAFYIFWTALDPSGRELAEQHSQILEEASDVRWQKMRDESNPEYFEQVLEATRERARLAQPSPVFVWLKRAGIGEQSQIIQLFALNFLLSFAFASLCALLLASIFELAALKLLVFALPLFFGLLASFVQIDLRSKSFDRGIGAEMCFVIEQIICSVTSGEPYERSFKIISEVNQQVGVCPELSAILAEVSSQRGIDPLEALSTKAKELRSRYLFHVARILKVSQDYASARTMQLRELKATIQEEMKIRRDYSPFKGGGLKGASNQDGQIEEELRFGLSLLRTELSNGEMPFPAFEKAMKTSAEDGLVIHEIEEARKVTDSESELLIELSKRLPNQKMLLIISALLLAINRPGRVNAMLKEITLLETP